MNLSPINTAPVNDVAEATPTESVFHTGFTSTGDIRGIRAAQSTGKRRAIDTGRTSAEGK